MYEGDCVHRLDCQICICTDWDGVRCPAADAKLMFLPHFIGLFMMLVTSNMADELEHIMTAS